MKRKKIAWILCLIGAGLVALGYLFTGGFLDQTRDYIIAYVRNGSGWLVLFGIALLFSGFLVFSRNALLPKE